MPRTVTNETFDSHGTLIHSEQVTVPSIIAGRHRETHQVVVGGAAMRIAPSSAATVVANLRAGAPVAATGQRQNGWLSVISDLGSGWLPEIALIAI